MKLQHKYLFDSNLMNVKINYLTLTLEIEQKNMAELQAYEFSLFKLRHHQVLIFSDQSKNLTILVSIFSISKINHSFFSFALMNQNNLISNQI